MSSLSLRIPDSLHRVAKSLAKKEHVSLNQLIVLALAEKISVLETHDYLQKRANRGDRKKFLHALQQAPNTDPDDVDKR